MGKIKATLEIAGLISENTIRVACDILNEHRYYPEYDSKIKMIARYLKQVDAQELQAIVAFLKITEAVEGAAAENDSNNGWETISEDQIAATLQTLHDWMKYKAAFGILPRVARSRMFLSKWNSPAPKTD